jgi:peptidyl-dipeptidase A
LLVVRGDKWRISSEKAVLVSRGPGRVCSRSMAGAGGGDALGAADGDSLARSTEEMLAPLTAARNAAWWDAQVDASDEKERRRAETELDYVNALGDRELFDAVRGARENGAQGLVRRRLDLLHDLMLPRQVPGPLRERIVELEASVDVRFARHRGVVRGEEVGDIAIKRILRESEDVEERREAWEASKTVGEAVADDVRELARLRNESARSLGYRDWFALSVSVSELDEQKLFETLAACDGVTREPYARWKAALDERLAARFGCDVAELRPWHYADPFFQEPPPDGAVDLDPLFRERDIVELGRRTFEGIGVDMAGTLARSDLFPRAGKCQHAFCLDVDRSGDIRVLMNVTDNHDSMDTLLHELGHAVYDLGFEDELPWILRDTHLVTTEATALLFGALAGQREWLERVLELDRVEAAALEDRLHAARAAALLLFTRWVLVMTGFERKLYADPESDLDTAWWELVSEYQRVTPPDGRRAPDWAAKIHVAVAPVYYHTYLYGSIVALQLADALRSASGGIVDRPDSGRLLAERLFAPGLAVRWDRLVEDVTGTPLSVDSLAREVTTA